MINKFVKRPIVVEAQQLTDESFWDVLWWITDSGGKVAGWFWDADGRWAADGRQPSRYIEIETLEGRVRARDGDWIIRGVAGEFYPCKPDIFVSTYEGKP